LKPGIRAKLFLISLAVIGISVIATEFYLSWVLERQLTARIRSDLLTRARLVAERVGSSGVSFADEKPMDTLADGLGRISGVRVTLVRSDGTVAGDSEVEATQLSQLQNHADRPEIAASLTHGEGASTRYSATVGRLMMYGAVPVVRGGTAIGTARVPDGRRRPRGEDPQLGQR
jgi:two-component system phosphate regulon sensor histidine kinase PhoR